MGLISSRSGFSSGFFEFKFTSISRTPPFSVLFFVVPLGDMLYPPFSIGFTTKPLRWSRRDRQPGAKGLCIQLAAADPKRGLEATTIVGESQRPINTGPARRLQ